MTLPLRWYHVKGIAERSVVYTGKPVTTDRKLITIDMDFMGYTPESVVQKAIDFYDCDGWHEVPTCVPGDIITDEELDRYRGQIQKER